MCMPGAGVEGVVDTGGSPLLPEPSMGGRTGAVDGLGSGAGYGQG
jgi:hypothetical protein